MLKLAMKFTQPRTSTTHSIVINFRGLGNVHAGEVV